MLNDIDDILEKNMRLADERDDLLRRLNQAEAIILTNKQEDGGGVLSNAPNTITGVSPTSDQTYRMFIENMPEGVVTLLPDGIILYSNLSFAKITGLPLEKVIGSNILDFIPVPYKANFQKSLDVYLQSNSKVEIATVNAQDSQSDFIVSLKKLQLQDLMAISLVWTDVTDQKKVEAELISSNQALKTAINGLISSENNVNTLNDKLNLNIKILKDANVDLATFIHLASHDLQEPLRKLSVYSSLVARNYTHALDTPGVGYLNSLQNASLKMSKLIADVLEYLTLSQNEARFSATNLNAVIDQAVSSFQDEFDESTVNLVVEKNMQVIEADHHLLVNLIKNIISNSLKFKKPDVTTEIHISHQTLNGLEIAVPGLTLPDEEFCIVYIRDNGIGFQKDYLNQIFMAFKKLNSSFSYPGSGIGLAICKKIAEKHNGFITAESKVGEGSVFRIILPVHQVSAWQIS